MTFGLIVMAMISSLGDISGAHFNPAVTVGFAFSNRLQWSKVLPYVIAQCMGALFASFSLKLLFPTDNLLGATLPSGPDLQSFILEFFLSAILMFVILNVSTGEKEKGITAGIVIGAVIGLEAMFAGSISGASMNPARSLSPALVSGNFSHLWIYLSAPFLGAIGGVAAFKSVRS